MVIRAAARGLVAGGSVIACAVAVHTAINLARLRRPTPRTSELRDDVAVLIPARNESATIAATVRSALAQTGVPGLRVVVLDDDSSDGTTSAVPDDARVEVLAGGDAPLPPGWLGKPWACMRLADHVPDASVLAFVDADVHLQPDALHALVDTLRSAGLDLVAPFPRQLAGSWPERLVQPLVTWLWAATLPVAWAERSARPSLAAANGQLLVFDAAAYRRIGGHGAVGYQVLEDVALMRALRSAGGRAATVDGAHLAECRMYTDAGSIVDGYAKSLWSAFGGPVGSAGVAALALTVYVVPAIAMLAGRNSRTRALGTIGYLAGVSSRAMVSRRTGERTWPDSALHPISITLFVVLNAVSWQRHLSGRNSWKGRPLRTSP